MRTTLRRPVESKLTSKTDASVPSPFVRVPARCLCRCIENKGSPNVPIFRTLLSGDPMNAEQKKQYQEDGYVIVDDAVDTDMLQPLLDAARRMKAKVRAGEVNVFTHWTPEKEPWGIRGILSPEFNEPIFAEYLLSDSLMKYVEPMLGKELRLGGVMLFTTPDEVDWSGGWHRDFGSNERDGAYEVEMEVLNRPNYGLRWHLALVDDACLQLVPGSHKRYRTDEERECLLNSRHKDLSTQQVMDLKAGQTIFWQGNTVHRGIYNAKPERLSLAGSWRQETEGDEPQKVDERYKWMCADSVRAFLPKKMHGYYDRWRALQLD